MKKRLGRLGLVVAALGIGYAVMCLLPRDLDDFKDNFLNKRERS